MEAEGHPVLTLHGGDFLYPSVMSKYTAAAPMVRASTCWMVTRMHLLGLLQSSISRLRQGDGRFLQVSGLRFRYHVDQSTSPPSYRIGMEDVWVCPRADLGVPLNEYVPLAKAEIPISAATIKYLWEKGEEEGYSLFAPDSRPKLLDGKEVDWAPLVVQAFREGAARHGAGERNLFMTEQLAFEQRLREGGAVDRHEGSVPACSSDGQCARPPPCRCRSRRG